MSKNTIENDSAMALGVSIPLSSSTLDRLRISSDEVSQLEFNQNASLNPSLMQPSIDGLSPFDLSSTNLDQIRQFLFNNQASQVFDTNFSNMGSYHNIHQALESSINNTSTVPLTSGFPTDSTQLRIENVKFETSEPSNMEEDRSTDSIKINFLRSPLVRSKSATQTTDITNNTRARSATYPMDQSTSFPLDSSYNYSPSSNSTAQNAQEILGQIIMKQSIESNEFMDIAPYVAFPQHEAAKKLNMPSSTLSKKWKDATVNRKWPYRTLAKIDKEIATIMHNIHRNSNGAVDKDVEQQLARLLQVRQTETRPVIVRMT